MNCFRTLSLVLMLCFGLQALPSLADDELQESSGSGDPVYQVQSPPAFSMIADLVIARPFLVAATAVGAVVFVVSLPFTALGGNVKDAGNALVVAPGKSAFVRCLGCTGDGYGKRQ
ncbi:multidrug transporter [Pseudomonas putida]